jgi:hypothetical protein
MLCSRENCRSHATIHAPNVLIISHSQSAVSTHYQNSVSQTLLTG